MVRQGRGHQRGWRRFMVAVGMLTSWVGPGCSSRPATQEISSAIVSTIALQLKERTNSCSANHAQDSFQVINGGSSSVKLSDIKIKFWINDTSGQAVVAHISTGGCVTGVDGKPSCVHQVAGVTATATSFSPACGPDSSHQANWEITISNADGAMLPAGATWRNLQSALNLADHSRFTPGSGSWFSPCLSEPTYLDDPHFAVYYQGNLVFSNGINAPDCRGPQGTQPINGYTPPPSSPVVGPAPADKVISLAVGLPVRDLAGLQSFVEKASDPSNKSTYRKYMSAADVTADQSPSTADYNAVLSWAQALGLKTGTYANRLAVDVTGTVASIEQAFHANVILAQRPDGSTYYRLDRKPSVDLGVALLGVSGLDNYVLPKSVVGTSPIPGAFQSSDLRGAYLGGAGAACAALDGAGQSIGIFSLTGFTPGDITDYQTSTGLMNVPAVQVQTSNDPAGLPPAQAPPLAATGNLENWEISLDIEMAMAMAPAAQVVVFEGTNPDSIYTNMTNNPDVGQFSTSFLQPPSALTPTLFTVLAAQGQSFFVGSGDWGAFEPPTQVCPPAVLTGIANGTVVQTEFAINDQRVLPFVTVVGGSQLSTANGLWSGETTWTGSGGGILTGVPIPAYQVNVNAANAEVSTANRNLPDVALVARNLYIVTSDCNNVDPRGVTGQVVNKVTITACSAAQITGGLQRAVAGTSASGPLFAGLMALINQQGATMSLGRVGFANPTLYQIGSDPARYPNAFHDIGATVGSTATNTCGFTYNAGAGYDLTTGWGTPQCGLITEINVRPTITVGVSGTADSGPLICVNGQGFTPGGTVTVQYAGVPEAPNDVKVVSSTEAVSAGGAVVVKDNERVFVNQSVAAGVPGCTADVIASGTVSVNVIDNSTGASATATMPASYWCAIGQAAPFGAGCSISPATIHYSQYAACTHVPLNPGIASADPNGAYVVFQIDEVDNGSPQAFNFDPDRLFVQQATKHFADSGLRIYDRIFGPFAAAPDTFGPGVDAAFQVDEDIAVVVSTSTADGSIEANQTSYSLSYDEQPGDPQVTFAKINASQTSWPIEQDCCSIGLAICQ